MRKNYEYIPQIPSSRNGFIDMVNSKKEVILVPHELLMVLSKEINESISSGKSGKFFTKCVPVMLLTAWNPLGWILSGIVLLGGIVGISGNQLKGYKLYAGEDSDGNAIITLHHKKVDLKYDTIKYPDWVKAINYDKANKKVKTK